ncbi:50S ribosomal protein L11 methyltransferase [bacterium]|nr:50S ribosomal protein L11 methyltransferase [bacterium]
MTSRIDYNNPNMHDCLGLSYHYELVSDGTRVKPFREAVEMACPGKRVLESGTGSGLLSILAARSGAERVYAVEKDPHVARFARENIRRNGCQDRVLLIEKDVRDLTLDDLEGDPVDVVIAENLSTWMVTEPQITIMNHILDGLVRKDVVCLPQCIDNTVELTQSVYKFEDVIELRTHFFQFSGIEAPVPLSDQVLFRKYNMTKSHETDVDGTIRIRVTRDGVLNSLRLTSPLVVHENIRFHASDSLMPPVVVPLKQDVQVKRGEEVGIHIRYSINTAWEAFECGTQ